MAALTPAIRYVTLAPTPPAILAPPPPAVPAIRNAGLAQQMQPVRGTALASIRNASSRLASSRKAGRTLAPTRSAPRPPASPAQHLQLAPPPATCSSSDRLRLPHVRIAGLLSQS